jgi:hypothetical protein
MSDDNYSEEETVARREATLRRMLATPPEKHKPLGKEATGKRPKRAKPSLAGDGQAFKRKGG